MPADLPLYTRSASRKGLVLLLRPQISPCSPHWPQESLFNIVGSYVEIRFSAPLGVTASVNSDVSTLSLGRHPQAVLCYSPTAPSQVIRFRAQAQGVVAHWSIQDEHLLLSLLRVRWQCFLKSSVLYSKELSMYHPDSPESDGGAQELAGLSFPGLPLRWWKRLGENKPQLARC